VNPNPDSIIEYAFSVPRTRNDGYKIYSHTTTTTS